MTSAIDATKPITGNPTTESVRDQFATAAAEITALQNTAEQIQLQVDNIGADLADKANIHGAADQDFSASSLSVTGNLTQNGLARRIKADYSNATINDRAMFQTSTVNANTVVEIIPNGTASVSQIVANNNSDPTNASMAVLNANSNTVVIGSTYHDAGTVLPMSFTMVGVEAMRIHTSRNIGMSCTPAAWTPATVGNATIQFGNVAVGAVVAGAGIMQNAFYNSGWKFISAGANLAIYFIETSGTHSWYNASGAGKAAEDPATLTLNMRLTETGNLGLSCIPAAWQAGSSGNTAIQMGKAACFAIGNSTYLGNNIYYDGTNFRAITTGQTAVYRQLTTGVHRWLSAASVTAGNVSPIAILMDLDTGGNLLGLATMRTIGYTVATLPAGTIGMRAYVTDATAPTYLGALTGGGAVTCPVFYNGTAWVSA